VAIKNINEFFPEKFLVCYVQEALSRGVLVYLPQILTGGAPILRLVNFLAGINARNAHKLYL
jgi:hypothetical protein